MPDIIKMTLGFAGIIFVGLVGVFVSEMFKLGNMNTTIVTIDNITRVR